VDPSLIPVTPPSSDSSQLKELETTYKKQGGAQTGNETWTFFADTFHQNTPQQSLKQSCFLWVTGGKYSHWALVFCRIENHRWGTWHSIWVFFLLYGCSTIRLSSVVYKVGAGCALLQSVLFITFLILFYPYFSWHGQCSVSSQSCRPFPFTREVGS
jgi:hypothetical protein